MFSCRAFFNSVCHVEFAPREGLEEIVNRPRLVYEVSEYGSPIAVIRRAKANLPPIRIHMHKLQKACHIGWIVLDTFSQYREASLSGKLFVSYCRNSGHGFTFQFFSGVHRARPAFPFCVRDFPIEPAIALYKSLFMRPHAFDFMECVRMCREKGMAYGYPELLNDREAWLVI